LKNYVKENLNSDGHPY